MNNEFKAGEYVVLLKSCTGKDNWAPCLAENYVYRLKSDSSNNHFCVELRTTEMYTGEDYDKGDSWMAKNYPNNQLQIRLATEYEKAEYIKAKRPVKVKEFIDYELY